MEAWDGRTERRGDYVNIVSELAVVKQQLKEIVERREVHHRETQAILAKVTRSIDGNGGEGLLTRISLQAQAIVGIRKELSEHSVWDRWLFGSILTMLMAILGRLFMWHG